MAQSEENKLPMIAEHVVTRLQDSIVVFGGCLVSGQNGIFNYSNQNRVKHTIWMYNLRTDLWKKCVIPEDEATPLTSGVTGVTIKTDIYVFAAPKDDLGTVWRLKRDRRDCFSWREVPVKKAPSYRHDMVGWEYSEKMWIFSGCGPSLADLNHCGIFSPDLGHRNNCILSRNTDPHSVNNQLLCFDPSCSEWTNVKCAGAVPSHRCYCTSAVISNKVWLYGGNLQEHLGELYNMDMNQHFWTQIQCKPSIPKVVTPSLIFTCSKLVLHGYTLSSSNDPTETWVLDLSSLSWREYEAKQLMTLWGHKCISGLNSCVFIGGFDEPQQYKTWFITLAPKSLQEIAIKTINEHKTPLPMDQSLQEFAIKTIKEHKTTLPWKLLPKKLHYNIMGTLL